MAIVKQTIVKENWKSIYEIATERLENIDAEIETKVEEYRNKLLEEVGEDRVELQIIVGKCTDEIEVEVPDEIPAEEEISEETTEQQSY